MSAEGLVRICPLPLFAWEALEDSPSLLTVRDLLAVVPDGRLLDALRRSRGHGRDDYPVQTLWGVVLLTVLLRHPTFDACLGDLRRNAALRRLIGIQRDADVPKKWNLSRFLKVLGTEPHLTLLREVFDAMIRPLGEVVKDLGRHTAGDSSGLLARDEALPAWVAEAQANLPEDRIKTLAYDKAADDEKVHLALQKAGIEPVIQNRSMWKEALERMLPGHDGRSNIVYDEAGTVYCYDQTSEPPVRRRMAFIGHEPSRGTLKYRCPAMHEGWRCPSHDRCNAEKKYGKTVRVKQEIDLRRFPPIPRATQQFERLYRGRTAVERVNGRLKVFWGADDGNIAGAARFFAFLGTVMVVHAGLATLLASAPRREGTLGKMRLIAVTKALREKLAG